MKNKLIYLVALVATIGMVSCSRDEANKFDDSAAERRQALKTATIETLCSAPNGWEMVYFPNPAGAGYAFLMEFKENGEVQIAAQNTISNKGQLYAEETSLWGIDYTQSVSITFNSYNEIFHIFADPLSDGVGYEGDYEFVILESNDGQFKLKGKKHEAYVYLNRLADDQDWNAYFKAIDQFSWSTFCGYEKATMLYSNGSNGVIEMTYNNGLFSYEDEKGVNNYFATIYTPTGLHCYESLPNNLSIDAKDFVFNADSSKLVCTQNNAIYLTVKQTLIDFFMERLSDNVRWTVIDSLSSTVFNEQLKPIKDSADNKGAQIKRIAISKTHQKKSIILVDYLVENKLYQGILYINTYKYEDILTLAYSSYDESLVPLLLRIADTAENGAKALAKLICGSYTLKSKISKININQLQLIGSEGKTIVVAGDHKAL